MELPVTIELPYRTMLYTGSDLYIHHTVLIGTDEAVVLLCDMHCFTTSCFRGSDVKLLIGALLPV